MVCEVQGFPKLGAGGSLISTRIIAFFGFTLGALVLGSYHMLKDPAVQVVLRQFFSWTVHPYWEYLPSMTCCPGGLFANRGTIVTPRREREIHIYIYMYEPDTFWVNAPGILIIYHENSGKLCLRNSYIYIYQPPRIHKLYINIQYININMLCK